MAIHSVYAITWEVLKIMIIEVHCPRDGIQKLEQELQDLTMKGTDIVAYSF